MVITKEIAREIADKKAKELNYDIGNMNITVDENKNKWNNYLAVTKIKDWQPELIAPLENKNYWIIYYQPRKFQKGGDLWIFISKKTSEILTIIQGD